MSNWADEWTGLLILWHRLYSKGRVLGHKRSKRNTRPNTSLLQIEGVATKEEAQFYLGKVRRAPLLCTRASGDLDARVVYAPCEC